MRRRLGGDREGETPVEGMTLRERNGTPVLLVSRAERGKIRRRLGHGREADCGGWMPSGCRRAGVSEVSGRRLLATVQT